MDKFMKGRYYNRMNEINRIYGKVKKEEEKKREKNNRFDDE